MRDKAQAARDARIVAATEEGERLIGYLLDYCHIFKSSMGQDCNPNQTLFNEGQRSVGNEIVALIVNEPDRFKSKTLRSIASQAEGTDI